MTAGGSLKNNKKGPWHEGSRVLFEGKILAFFSMPAFHLPISKAQQIECVIAMNTWSGNCQDSTDLEYLIGQNRFGSRMRCLDDFVSLYEVNERS